MSAIHALASALGRKDEQPNIDLAVKIVDSNDTLSIKELVNVALQSKKAMQYDSIKVLYEIAQRLPKLVSPYIAELLAVLASRDNRMQWGAMTALASLVNEKPQEIASNLPTLTKVAQDGSVITRDNYVKLLVNLSSYDKHYKKSVELLFDELTASPVNQLPMYAEYIQPVIKDHNGRQFIEILSARLDGVDKPSKRKRIEKVIRAFS